MYLLRNLWSVKRGGGERERKTQRNKNKTSKKNTPGTHLPLFLFTTIFFKKGRLGY